MPSRCDTLLASEESAVEQQASSRVKPMSSLSNSFIVTPVQSQPRSLRMNAATELSTPPLIATITLSLTHATVPPQNKKRRVSYTSAPRFSQ
jgi:hypothetical protein